MYGTHIAKKYVLRAVAKAGPVHAVATMTCSRIDGRGIVVLLEAEDGRIRGQLRSTAAVDSSFEIGRFEVPWKVLAQVVKYGALSFSSPFGFVVLRRCGQIVEVCYGNDLGNEYGLAVLSVDDYRALMNSLRTPRLSNSLRYVVQDL